MHKKRILLLSLTLRVLITTVVCGVSDEEHQCPITCFCDSISSYVHCEGAAPLVEPGQRMSTPIPRSTRRLEWHELTVDGNKLRWEFTRHLFPHGLLELVIRNSDISELGNGSLITLNKLSSLDLAHNNINSIQHGVFDSLVSLRHLDLSWNSLSEIQGIFVSLNQLETLKLNNNQLRVLGIKTFDGLTHLQWLDLSYNSITKIEPGSFLPTSNLERLVLGHNPLTNLQRLEFLGARLRYMDVSHMKLKRAPESLGPSVRELRALGNELTILQRGDLDSYPSLWLLDLSSNHLEVIEDDALGRLEFLSRIWLTDNKLERIPSSLPRSLRALYLDCNNIHSISPTDVQGLPRLQQLSLSANKLTVVSVDILASLPGLRRLNLSKNQLNPSSTFGPTGLEELDLSYNTNLTVNSLTSVPHLHTLYLNNMSTICFNLKEVIIPLLELTSVHLVGSKALTAHALQNEIWYGLRELNIQSNNLTTLPEALWNSTGKLRTIYLSNNPWNCSDRAMNTINTRDGRLKIIDSEHMQCYYPEEMRGVLPPALNSRYSSISMQNNVVTPPPSLAPTRIQIVPPTSSQPNVTAKPESTAPLNLMIVTTTHNAVQNALHGRATDEKMVQLNELPKTSAMHNTGMTTTKDAVSENTRAPTSASVLFSLQTPNTLSLTSTLNVVTAAPKLSVETANDVDNQNNDVINLTKSIDVPQTTVKNNVTPRTGGEHYETTTVYTYDKSVHDPALPQINQNAVSNDDGEQWSTESMLNQQQDNSINNLISDKKHATQKTAEASENNKSNKSPVSYTTEHSILAATQQNNFSNHTLLDQVPTTDSKMVTSQQLESSTTTSIVETTPSDVIDYEELASVVEAEEFYEEPGERYSDSKADKIHLQLPSETTPNIPIGFLSILSMCILAALLLAVYQCNQHRKWQRLQSLHLQEEMLQMDVVNEQEEREPFRW